MQQMKNKTAAIGDETKNKFLELKSELLQVKSTEQNEN